MNLHVAHVNVRSLLANFNTFQNHLVNSGYDIVGVTETWLGADIDGTVVNVNNHNCFYQNRPSRRGGGVGIYIKNNVRCETLLSASLEYIEYLWIKIIFYDQVVILGIIYRPPNADITQFFSSLEDMLYNIYSNYDNIICMGDFNINMLNFNNSNGSRLESIFCTFNMDQLIREPTRISSNSLFLLDLYSLILKTSLKLAFWTPIRQTIF